MAVILPGKSGLTVKNYCGINAKNSRLFSLQNKEPGAKQGDDACCAVDR
jgi:hypothetical protein